MGKIYFDQGYIIQEVLSENIYIEKPNNIYYFRILLELLYKLQLKKCEQASNYIHYTKNTIIEFLAYQAPHFNEKIFNSNNIHICIYLLIKIKNKS